MPVTAKRRFAQHFLEPAWVSKLIKVINPTPGDRFLEIGPGRGELTWALASAGTSVTAVEIDRDLARRLRAAAPEGVTVLTADFLKLDLVGIIGTLRLAPGARPAQRMTSTTLRVIGNLPYNASVPILVKILRASQHGTAVRDATLMLQREVADRVTAGPGSVSYGPLAIMTQLHATARRILTLPPGAFRPIPRVHSSVVSLRFRSPATLPGHPELFEAMTRALFTQRRKQGVNALRPFASVVSSLPVEEVFARARVDPQRRPGELELSELTELSEVLSSTGR